MAHDLKAHKSPKPKSAVDQALNDFYLLEASIPLKWRQEDDDLDDACMRLEAWLLERKEAMQPVVSVPAGVAGKVVGLAEAQAGGIA